MTTAKNRLLLEPEHRKGPGAGTLADMGGAMRVEFGSDGRTFKGGRFAQGREASAEGGKESGER